jgi:hypothetical protein
MSLMRLYDMSSVVRFGRCSSSFRGLCGGFAIVVFGWDCVWFCVCVCVCVGGEGGGGWGVVMALVLVSGMT